MTSNNAPISLAQIASVALSGNRAMARIDLESILPNVSNDASAWIWQGWLSDSPEACVTALTRALRLDPDSEIAQAGLVWAKLLIESRENADSEQEICEVERAADGGSDFESSEVATNELQVELSEQEDCGENESCEATLEREEASGRAELERQQEAERQAELLRHESLVKEEERLRQEELRREQEEQERQEELAREEEAKRQEELRLREEERLRQEELKREQEEQERQEELARKEEAKRQEELRLQEEERLRQEELRREQEEQERQEELARKEEAKRQEELRLQEEERLRQEELKREQEEQERQEELKRQEAAKRKEEERRRCEELAREEEISRQEELRREEEARLREEERQREEEEARQEELAHQEEEAEAKQQADAAADAAIDVLGEVQAIADIASSGADQEGAGRESFGHDAGGETVIQSTEAVGQHTNDESPEDPGKNESESLRAEEASADSAEVRPLILTVDDSPTVRKLVSLTLERVGYEVITAADGVAALNLLAERLPVLILSDINMPRITGYKLCKLVKRHERTSHIPVVMLSGKNGVFDKVRGQVVGCSDYITKPFESHELIEKVRQYALATASV